MRQGANRAGRSVALFLVASGVLTIVNDYLPGSEHLDRAVLGGIGLAAIGLGALAWVLPWARWHARATLAFVPVGLALIALANVYGGVSSYSYAVYFVVVFTWIGLAHPPWTSVYLAPFATAAYVLPAIADADLPVGAISSVTVAIPVCVLVAETVARTVRKHEQASAGLHVAMDALELTRAESQRRAELLAAVARATESISTLRSDDVLRAVVDAATQLGLDSSYFAMFDEDVETFRVAYARGLLLRVDGSIYPASVGLPGLARERGGVVQLDDVLDESLALGRASDEGIQAGIAAPVRVDGRIRAVLVGCSRQRLVLGTSDVEAFELLASLASRAVDNAMRYEEERRTHQALAQVVLRDEQTGIGNRRHGEALLRSVGEGDAVVLIDLDHFKEVNDTRGHAVGDQVLAQFGEYLRTHLRFADTAARFGGDEFLIVLHQVGDGARPTLDRLIEGWRREDPVTTFSLGVAQHRADQSVETTLEQADAALYASKRMGRDGITEYAVESEAS